MGELEDTVSKYEPVEAIPEGVVWKQHVGRPSQTHRTLLSTPGGAYKLVRSLETGEVKYFKLKDSGPVKSPAEIAASKEKIDAEPAPPKQVRYRVGALCWLIEPSSVAPLWYLCNVVARIGEDRATFGEPKRIILRPVTGWDAERKVQWPHGVSEEGQPEELSLVANPRNMQRLRPLKARRT